MNYSFYNNPKNTSNTNNQDEYTYLPKKITNEYNAKQALKHTISESKVSKIFFSKENMDRIQKQLKSEILKRSNNKYNVKVNQNEQDLLVNMRAVYFEYAYNTDCNPIRQVKLLNKQVVEYVIVDVMSNIKQYYGYLKDINTPIQPIMRPVNTNSAGRKTLPALTSSWGF